MKKIYIFAIVALVSMTVTGCKDFLDVQPEGTPTTDTYFQNDSQAENAVKALYAPLYDGDDGFGREIYWEQDAANQMVPGKSKGWAGTLLTMNYTGDEDPLRSNYNLLYKLFARANWMVQALLDKKEVTELTAVETRSLGEAYFMRGFVHFCIAYRYGTKDQGVPAVQYEKVPEGYNYDIPEQQTSVIKNYEMIEADFNSAMEYLPLFDEYSAAERGRAHKGAALGMKARLYAYWATWDNTKWKDVISVVDQLEQAPYSRGLATSYSKLFGVDWNPGPDGWWGPEYIWSFPSNGGADSKRGGIEWTGVVLENTGWGVYNGWGQNKPTLDAYREFKKDGDTTFIAGTDWRENERLYKCILQYNQPFQFPKDNTLKEIVWWNYYSSMDIETGFQINKWMEAWTFPDCVNAGYVNYSGDWPTSRCNFHCLRFADCLLLRAEAYLAGEPKDPTKATKDINKVRARVHLDTLMAGSATMKDIYHERYCELCYEPASDHFADLKRWAVSGDATIKALAIKELEKHPDVLHYVNRKDPQSALDPAYDYTTEGGSPYEDFISPAKKWADYKIVFPYPSTEISKSAGALKQNAGY